jgi:hypothetical protein
MYRRIEIAPKDLSPHNGSMPCTTDSNVERGGSVNALRGCFPDESRAIIAHDVKITW